MLHTIAHTRDHLCLWVMHWNGFVSHKSDSIMSTFINYPISFGSYTAFQTHSTWNKKDRVIYTNKDTITFCEKYF